MRRLIYGCCADRPSEADRFPARPPLLPTLTVHVREGPQYRAFVNLLRHVCLTAGLDEVLPEPPNADLDHRFVQVRVPSAPPVYSQPHGLPAGAAAESLLVRRTRTHKRPSARLRVDLADPATGNSLCVPQNSPVAVH